MISIAFCLTLATYASAQVVSMIANPDMAASASGSASASSASPASSSMSAPAAPTSSSGSGYSGYSPNQYNQNNQYGSSSSSAAYNQYTSAAPQYTPPPQSEAMPYESFMNGGYKSMDCGYGYSKGSDGSCMSKESWVRTSHLGISRVIQFTTGSIIRSILPRAAIRCLSHPRST